MNKIAIVFPGQGSQFVGMMKDFYSAFPEIRPLYQQASEVLGYDLYQICVEGPEDKLGRTEVTQPAVLVAGYAIWQIVKSRFIGADLVMAGHSLGEYTALACSEAIAFRDAVSLVQYRGSLMQNAVPEGQGSMAAVLGLDDSTVEKVCKKIMDVHGGVVEPVNYNAPGQVVIAGEKELIEKAVIQLKESGAKRALPLAVSVPAHCSLMKAAASELSKRLSQTELKMPIYPVVQNVDAEVQMDVNLIRQKLVLQLHSPVQWTKSVLAIADMRVEKMIECGPGKVLTSLNKRISQKLECSSLGDIEKVKNI